MWISKRVYDERMSSAMESAFKSGYTAGLRDGKSGNDMWFYWQALYSRIVRTVMS